jgi:hypothetical protein
LRRQKHEAPHALEREMNKAQSPRTLVEKFIGVRAKSTKKVNTGKGDQSQQNS